MTLRPSQKRAGDFGPWYRQAVIIGLIALMALAWQFAFPGYYQVNDDDAGIVTKYVPQLAESIRHGVLYPRWMQEDFKGYGSPVFAYYSPFFYYIVSLSSLAGLSLPLSVALAKLLGLFLGAMFLFLFLKESLGESPALIAAVCYILLPTRILDLYYLNSPAGRFAQAWMPMLLYFTKRTVDNPLRRRYIAGMGVSYAALVMTHLATAFIFTPFVIAYGLFGAAGRFKPAEAAKLIVGLSVGVLMCAVYFLPVLLTRGLVHIEYMGGEFLYFRNYLFYAFQRPDAEPLWLVQGNVILLELGVAVLLYYTLRRRTDFRLGRDTRFYFCAAAFCIFMMSSPSAFFWKHVPGLTTVQFPYRFTPVYLLFFSALSGSIIGAYLGWDKKPRGLTFIAATALMAVMANDIALVARSQSYGEAEAAAVARKLNLPEYLPKSVDPRAAARLEEDNPMLSSKDDFDAGIIRWENENREFTVDSSRGLELSIRTFWFPGWRAWVDGKETRIGVEKGTGAMLIELLPGRHKVELRFTNTPVRSAGAAISLLTVILLLLPYGRLSALLRRD